MNSLDDPIRLKQFLSRGSPALKRLATERVIMLDRHDSLPPGAGFEMLSRVFLDHSSGDVVDLRELRDLSSVAHDERCRRLVDLSDEADPRETAKSILLSSLTLGDALMHGAIMARLLGSESEAETLMRLIADDAADDYPDRIRQALDLLARHELNPGVLICLFADSRVMRGDASLARKIAAFILIHGGDSLEKAWSLAHGLCGSRTLFDMLCEAGSTKKASVAIAERWKLKAPLPLERGRDFAEGVVDLIETLKTPPSAVAQLSGDFMPRTRTHLIGMLVHRDNLAVALGVALKQWSPHLPQKVDVFLPHLLAIRWAGIIRREEMKRLASEIDTKPVFFAALRALDRQNTIDLLVTFRDECDIAVLSTLTLELSVGKKMNADNFALLADIWNGDMPSDLAEQLLNRAMAIPEDESSKLVQFLSGFPCARLPEIIEDRLRIETDPARLRFLCRILLLHDGSAGWEILRGLDFRLFSMADSAELIEHLRRRGDVRALDLLLEFWKPGETYAAKAALPLMEAHERSLSSPVTKQMRSEVVAWEKFLKKGKAEISSMDVAKDYLEFGLDQPLFVPLRCLDCGREYHYEIGFFTLDTRGKKFEESLHVGRIIKCKNCKEIESYEWTTGTRFAAMTEMLRFSELMKRGGKKKVADSKTEGRIRPILLTSRFTSEIFSSVHESWLSMRRHLDAAPDDPVLNLRAGNMLHNGGLPEDAVAYYQKALAAAPALVEAHLNLGKIALKAGEQEEAIGHFRNAVRSARQSTDQPDRAFLKQLVSESLMELLELVDKTGNREIMNDLIDTQGAIGRLQKSNEPATIILKNMDLSRKEDFDEWVEMFLPPKKLSYFERIFKRAASHSFETSAALESHPLVKESSVSAAPKLSRNAPCPCGSGRKYKKCCLGAHRASESEAVKYPIMPL